MENAKENRTCAATNATSPPRPVDVDWCRVCGGQRGEDDLCGDCQQKFKNQSERRETWAAATGVRVEKLCEDAGVGRQFCRNGEAPSYDDQGLREQLARLEKPRDRPYGLFVCGPVGSHKTHFLAARTVDAKRRGFSARLVNWPALCLEIRASYGAHSKECERGILARYADYKFLALDDVGVGRHDSQESDAKLSWLYMLLDQRYSRNLTTDVASNLTLKEIEDRYDARVARRIEELCTECTMFVPERTGE